MTSSPTPTPGTHGSHSSHASHHGVHPGAAPTPVQSVTDVPSSPGADRADRARRYLTAMGLRGLCFVGAIVSSGWLRWTFVAGAVVLPYIAVVLANAVGPGRKGTGRTTVDPRSTSPEALTGVVHDAPLSGERVDDPQPGSAPEQPRHDTSYDATSDATYDATSGPTSGAPYDEPVGHAERR